MSVTIILNDSLADQLRAQARVEQQPVEAFAHELPGELSGLEQAVENLRDDGN